ncbi:MAG: BatD family protein [Bacteroidales bacterium]|nr:BatD family protein [Bacteroidales bacterium]
MKNLILVLFVSASFSLNAQVEFKASISKDAVITGEPFKLEYKINQNFDNFTLPDFEGIELISGPNTSMQQSINFTNGEMQKTTSVTYTYFLKATEPGIQTIQPAEVKINGEYFYSNSVDVIVVEGNYHNPKEDKGKNIKGTSRL